MANGPRDPNIGVASVSPLLPLDLGVIGWLKRIYNNLVPGLTYVDITASSSASFGALGTTLSHITWHPSTTSPGAITVQDATQTAVTVFAGGAGSIVSLDARTIVEGGVSQYGAWTVATGANMTARVYYRL
jgi:hypothetical protein